MIVAMLAKVLDVCIELLTPETSCGAGRPGGCTRALGAAKVIFWCVVAVAAGMGLGQLN